MTTQQVFEMSAALESRCPCQSHSETSKAAARRAEPRSGTQKAIVLRFLRQRGAIGATDEEMQQALDMNPNTQRPRRVDLVREGFVVDSGRTRPVRSGEKATVWIAV